MALSVAVLGLGFAVSLDEEDCATRACGATAQSEARKAAAKIERRLGIERFMVVRFSLV